MLIISNYNLNIPSFLLELDMEYIIFDQSNIDKYITNNKKLGSFVKSKHSGHNLSDYFRYVIDQYENLPDIIRFIKGNIVPRHCDKEYFLANIKNNYFTGLYNEKLKNKLIFSRAQPGLVVESNIINIFRGKKKCIYFQTCNGLLKFLFKDPVYPTFIPFIPGGCFIIEKERILKYPRSFYELLYYLVTYTHFPQEAYIVERLLFTIFHANYKLSDDPQNLLKIIKSADRILDKTEFQLRLNVLFKLSKFLNV